MSGLSAGQGANLANASAAGDAIPRRTDRVRRLHPAGAAAGADLEQVPARFRDPLRGLRPVCDLAQFAGRLHRADVIRPRHVLRPRRIWLWSDDAEDRGSGPGRFRRHARDHLCGRNRDRCDLRSLKGNLLRLCHAGVPDVDPLHHPVLGVLYRRRPGAARRHSAAVLPSASICPTICISTSSAAPCWSSASC